MPALLAGLACLMLCAAPVRAAADRDAVLDHLLGFSTLSTAQQIENDLNKDGVIDVADLVSIINAGLPVARFTTAASAAAEPDGQVRVATIELSRPVQGMIELGVSGTARPGIDFNPPPALLPVSGSRVEVTLELLDDGEAESPRTIVLQLLNRPQRGYRVEGEDFHTLTIHDDDGGPTVVFFTSEASLEPERLATVPVRLRLNRPWTGTLNYQVGGTATPGEDFASLGGSLAINGREAELPVGLLRDGIFEGRETVELELVAGGGVEPAEPRRHTLGIVDLEARFEGQRTVAEEGDGLRTIGVAFNAPYTGWLDYTVGGTATPGLDHATSPTRGSVWVDGRWAGIPLQILDDLEMEDTELVALDLEFRDSVPDTDPDYDLGVPSRHLMLVQDNDTVWSGVMRGDGTEEAFHMVFRNDGSQVVARLVSSLEPGAEAGHASIGTLPEGEWVMNLTYTGDRLEGQSEPIPVEGTGLFGDVPFQRRLEFAVVPGNDPYLIQGRMLVGSFRSTLEPVDASLSHLRRRQDGLLLLVRGYSQFPMPEQEVVE